MKKISSILLLVIAVAAVLLLSRPAPGFTGSSIKNEDRFDLDFTYLHQTDTHIMPLQAGDSLSVEWHIEKGTLGITIDLPGNEKPIYTAKALTPKNDGTAAFSVTVPEDGEYTVTVHGKQADGSVHIRKE